MFFTCWLFLACKHGTVTSRFFLFQKEHMGFYNKPHGTSAQTIHGSSATNCHEMFTDWWLGGNLWPGRNQQWLVSPTIPSSWYYENHQFLLSSLIHYNSQSGVTLQQINCRYGFSPWISTIFFIHRIISQRKKHQPRGCFAAKTSSLLSFHIHFEVGAGWELTWDGWHSEKIMGLFDW